MGDDEDYEDEDYEALDEALFGEGPVHDTFPQGNELRWSDHFLNDRESGAGPDVLNKTNQQLLDEGFTSEEISEKLRSEANALIQRAKTCDRG